MVTPLFPSVFYRQPRYALCLLLILAPTLYFVLPIRLAPTMTPLRLPPNQLSDTGYRLAQSEAIYQKMLKDRDQLIARYGPHPSDLVMFPPNKSPWPAYTVWDYFPAAFNCPHEVRRVGMMGDGGKWVCGLSALIEKEDCVIYSVGLNRDCSFETDVLINTNHCRIYGYDYSVKGYSSRIPFSVRHRTEFHPYILGGVNRPASGKDAAMYTLKSLMEMNGHQYIDILKVDIEGWEFEAFTDTLKFFAKNGQPLPFGQLQLEIHVWDKNDKFEEFLKWWEGLEEAGLRPFWTEPNLVYVNYAGSRKAELAEYSFLNIKGDNAFIR